MSFFHSPSIHRHTDIDTYVHTHTSDRVINSSSVPWTQGFNGIGDLESQVTLPQDISRDPQLLAKFRTL